MQIKLPLMEVIEAGRDALFPNIKHKNPTITLYKREPNGAGGWSEPQKMEVDFSQATQPYIEFITYDK